MPNRTVSVLHVLGGAIIAALATLIAPPATADAAARALYPATAHYAISRDGAPAGTHRLQFGGAPALFTVSARTRATMRVYGLFDLDFNYDSIAVYQHGALLTLSASVSRGGMQDAFFVGRANAPDGAAAYRTQSGARAAAPLLPTNHWNSAAVQQTVLFNTLTGDLNRIAVADAGADTLHINGAATPARRYDITGDLQISLWYDQRGKWLQLGFSALGADYLFTARPPPPAPPQQ